MSILMRHHNANRQSKILICAQTNATVDKLCERAMELFPGSVGRNFVVRYGDDGRFNHSVQEVSVNGLARQHILVGESRQALEYQSGRELESYNAGLISEDEFTKIIDDIVVKLKALKNQRADEEAWRCEILRRAKFVFSTLGSSGADILDTCQFDLLIVHGANCVHEATSLIPIRHVDRVVLFGDRRQLQPMVTDVSRWFGYNRSTYERIIDGGYPCWLLDTQTQYHPTVYKQVSLVVYEGKVTNGQGTPGLLAWQSWAPGWGPNTIVNVPGEEKDTGNSFSNADEVKAVFDVLRTIFDLCLMEPKEVREQFTIGIVTPYSAQASALQRATNLLTVPPHISLK